MAQFINENNFTTNVKYPPKSSKYKRGAVLVDGVSYYVLYNDKICQLSITCNKDVPIILDVLRKKLSPKLLLWVAIPLSGSFMNCVKQFVTKGFGNPYISGTTPFGTKIPHSVVLLRKNQQVKSNAKRTILNIMYVLQQYNSGAKTCSLYARFSSKAINFLRKTSNMGHTKNGDHSISQKELGGKLHVSNTDKSGGKYVFVIGVDANDIEPGVEEEVMISPTRYNFHSHPHEAYVRHGVQNAWPSVTDYLGYLKLGNNTIFHCVATIEGLYIMSFGPYWVNKLKDVSKKFIMKHYEIDHSVNISPFEYVTRVNKIRYDGYPIYVVKFLPWGMASRTIFGVTYKKDGIACFSDENEIV